eukprot:UN05346
MLSDPNFKLAPFLVSYISNSLGYMYSYNSLTCFSLNSNSLSIFSKDHFQLPSFSLLKMFLLYVFLFFLSSLY